MISTVLGPLADKVRSLRRPDSAEAWLALEQSGRMTSRQQQALASWLNADPRNVAEYTRCRKVSALAGALRMHPEAVRAMPAYQAVEQARVRSRHSRPSFAMAAVATAVLLVAVGILFVPEQGGAVFSTDHGQQREVALDDGSTVYINTESTIRVQFSSDIRRVEIEKGQAYFEVSRDPQRPFVVRAGPTEVRVIGTKFDVRRGDQDVAVVVSEGRVQVLPGTTAPAMEPETDLILLPGNAVRIDYRNERLEKRAVDPELAIGWHKGIIAFESATLAEVVDEVNRYANKRLVIADDSLKELRISGRFRVGDLNSVTFALASGFDINVETAGDDILLMSNQP